MQNNILAIAAIFSGVLGAYAILFLELLGIGMSVTMNGSDPNLPVHPAASITYPGFGIGALIIFLACLLYDKSGFLMRTFFFMLLSIGVVVILVPLVRWIHLGPELYKWMESVYSTTRTGL